MTAPPPRDRRRISGPVGARGKRARSPRIDITADVGRRDLRSYELQASRLALQLCAYIAARVVLDSTTRACRLRAMGVLMQRLTCLVTVSTLALGACAADFGLGDDGATSSAVTQLPGSAN